MKAAEIIIQSWAAAMVAVSFTIAVTAGIERHSRQAQMLSFMWKAWLLCYIAWIVWTKTGG